MPSFLQFFYQNVRRVLRMLPLLDCMEALSQFCFRQVSGKSAALCYRYSPVSSDTTTIMASLTSLIPTAARWSGSQILAQFHVIRQWQVTGCRHDPVVPHDNSSVMKRSIMLKYIDQYLAGDQTIHLNTGTLIFCQLDQLLYYDQCSCFYFAHGKYSTHDTVNCLITEPYSFFGIKRKHGCQHLVFRPASPDLAGVLVEKRPLPPQP